MTSRLPQARGAQALFHRRAFTATLAGFPALMAAPRAAAQGQPARPNVLVILVDDLGAKDLGYLGAKDLRTPHLDRLAQEGVQFTNWYSNAPVCAPSRASVLSGRYPARAGVANNGGELTPGMPTLGSLFSRAGYRTAAIGKWHLGKAPNTVPNAHGFQYFYGFLDGCVDFYSHRFYWGEPGRPNFHDLWRNNTEIFEDGQYLTERITEETVQFVAESARQGKPFCGYIAYNAPHYPMHAPEKYVARFANLPPERRIYAAMVAAVDDGIGQIRAALERTGQWQNTLLVFLGDNGATVEKRAGLQQQYATAGDNGIFKGFKFSLFDGGIHVPALLRWPAGQSAWPAAFGKPRQESAVVQSMDLLPTLLHAAGIAAPSGLDGASLLPLLQGKGEARPALFWHQGGQIAVRKGKWKLVLQGRLFDRRPEGNQPLPGEDAVWLSDLEADPGERVNLRRQHPDVVDALQTLAESWRKTLPGQAAGKSGQAAGKSGQAAGK